MINRLLPTASIVAVMTLSTSSFAQNYDDNGFHQMNQNMQNLKQYVLNLGGYLGFNLSQQPGNVNSDLLADMAGLQVSNALTVYALIGARPVDTLMKTLAPTAIAGMQYYNGYTNVVYTNPNYNTPKPEQGSVTVNPLIDQPEYQQDPITQAVLNILATPNDSYCVSYDGSTFNTDCKLLTQGVVAINSIGQLADPQSYFTYQAVKSILPQLNANSLTGPLLYANQAQNQNTTSSPMQTNNQNKGLQSFSQSQAAQNFIRNVSGSLLRPTLPDQQTYDTYYAKAMNLSKNTSVLEQKIAQRALSKFMVQARSYAAQVSIGVSNLYSILAKRMPQNPANAQNPTSQALIEFQMATSRLFDADMKSNQQWIQKINSASSASVQKEIAVLLAQINYQLYLSRQLQERMLMTNSVILLNSASQGKPDASSLTSGS